MQIHLIRHADAEDGEDDAARPLSAKGRRQIRRMAAFLQRGGLIEAREFWHSPLVRARESAELLTTGLGWRTKRVEVAGIEPLANPAALVSRLNRTRRPVAVVGHEPHLSAVATLLLGGRAGPPAVVMKKGAVLALERSGRCWAVRWLVSPEEI
ncbi:MAG: phosphohistidine phosphatase SixA [Verrucomicrobiota bacterium]